ncbi:flagellar basal body rod protein FlgB [Vogesella indigofera]|uniref:flagellar basal body rod protein FlgB n=1 Tax=Vogesella indigofera TaxID=45465 RepID=UPI00234E7EC8|nr:flagellar basal body rod protein FlgB [Vogesella indigofera]MDC7707788.1 flagellar basal body rod protein FlgB [Vogesella indigofera]
MLDKISDHLNFFQQSLGLRAKKVEVIASNIANADTPGYKAVDFDFGKALQGQLRASQNGLALATSNERHLAAQGRASVDDGGLQYRSAVQPSLDGNTVDMDVERAAFTDNAMKYQSTLTFLNRRISGLMDAIKGGQ